MENNVKESIPAPVRKTIYWVFFVAALAIGSIQTFLSATGSAQPEWITGALAVIAYAGGALGLQAAIYVSPKADETTVESVPVEEVVVEESAGRHFAESDSDTPSSLM